MRRTILFLALGMALALVSGCGLIDYYFLPPPEDTAQELYEAGMDAMQDKNYSDAADYFNKLKDQFPFSPYTVDAELALGDAYFLDEDYQMAVDAYKEFDSMHPRHEQTPYVLFQVGLSNYMMFRSIDRRQTNVSDGLEYFQRVVEQYPDTDYAAAARDYIVKSRKILAEHELYIADFYWRSGRYGAAWKRYSYVVENFPDLTEVHDYAKQQAEFSYYEHQKEESQQERDETYGTWKEYFEWL